MLAPVADFFNDSVGLEKLLRLVQCSAQIAIALSLSASDAAPWIQARSHMVVARRFFRITKWIDAWQMAQQQLYSGSLGSVPTLLSVIKFSCFGMYMFLEMFTITDAMKVTNTSWGPGLLHESLKFWFYAIAASIMLSLYELAVSWTAVGSSSRATEKTTVEQQVAKEKDDEKRDPSVTDNKERAAVIKTPPTASTPAIYKKLFTDCCDILIPGTSVGWIKADAIVVGVTGCISTLISMGDIWTRIQSSKKAGK